MEFNVFCPLMGMKIENEICFDISMVVDDGAPDWSAPKEALLVPNFKEICTKCPSHRDD